MSPNLATPIAENPKYITRPKDKSENGKLFGPYNILWFKFDQELKYFNICLFTFFHIVTLYTFITFPYIEKWKFFVFTVVYGSTAGFGVTAGAHRYFTHRSYKANFLMKIILLVCYAGAGHNRVFEWVRDHRVHHKYSETNADPHNSNRGFFFAHVGWLMMKKHPEVTAKGAKVDMSDIINDPIVIWYDKYFMYMQMIFCFILPILIARYCFGESWYSSILVQIFARYVCVLNITWLVNSAAHFYGRRPYDKTINPRENLFVSIVAAGEGWHNYHHTFPWDYKTSEYGKLNVTTFWLDLFAKLGMVYDRKSPSDELVRKVIMKSGDGSHKDFHTYVTEEGEIGTVEN